MARKRKVSSSQSNEARQCAHCSLPVLEDGDLCPLHRLLQASTDRAQEALDSQDFTGAIGAGVGSIALQLGLPWLQRALQQQKQQEAAAQPKQAPVVEKKPLVDPFDVLGLDKNTATETDVRKIQRELNKIYHPDKGGRFVAAKVAEINEAARAALKYLKEKRSAR
jgi:hypothetical protein